MPGRVFQGTGVGVGVGVLVSSGVEVAGGEGVGPEKIPSGCGVFVGVAVAVLSTGYV